MSDLPAHRSSLCGDSIRVNAICRVSSVCRHCSTANYDILRRRRRPMREPTDTLEFSARLSGKSLPEREFVSISSIRSVYEGLSRRELFYFHATCFYGNCSKVTAW